VRLKFRTKPRLTHGAGGFSKLKPADGSKTVPVSVLRFTAAKYARTSP
jgi:hypothetical protein